jgi:hypothetical protein
MVAESDANGMAEQLFKNGTEEYREFYYGTRCLSQSSGV